MRDKLNGIGKIYCINLDHRKDRWAFMEDQFRKWGISDYNRVSAHDGKNDLRYILEGEYPPNMSSSEVGCVASHLDAVKQFYATGEPYAVIMEDDCDLDLVNYWNFSWGDFFKRLPYDWDVCQLSVICDTCVYFRIHKRFINDYSTACYLVTRHYAEKLIRLHCSGEKYKLDNGVLPRAVADQLVYNSGNTYTIPLLLYKNSLGSEINPSHVDTLHRVNYEIQSNFWKTNGLNNTIDHLMSFDSYGQEAPPRH
jgi:GR25 family glycosyltransferase involved in LPS biosynthesis